MSETGQDRGARVARRVLRWLVLALLALAGVWLLFEFVFPWVESRWYNPTVGLVAGWW